MLAESGKFEKKTKRGYENEKNQDILTINIIDTGKGIEEEDKKLVWNKYFRKYKY